MCYWQHCWAALPTAAQCCAGNLLSPLVCSALLCWAPGRNSWLPLALLLLPVIVVHCWGLRGPDPWSLWETIGSTQPEEVLPVPCSQSRAATLLATACPTLGLSGSHSTSSCSIALLHEVMYQWMFSVWFKNTVLKSCSVGVSVIPNVIFRSTGLNVDDNLSLEPNIPTKLTDIMAKYQSLEIEGLWPVFKDKAMWSYRKRKSIEELLYGMYLLALRSIISSATNSIIFDSNKYK